MKHLRYLQICQALVASCLLLIFIIPLIIKADANYGDAAYGACSYGVACPSGGTVLTISSSGTLSMSFTPSTAGIYCTAYDNVQYYSNNSTGYNLYLSSSSSTSSSFVSGANTIPSTSTVAGGGSASALSSSNTWGYSAYPNPWSLNSTTGVKFGDGTNTTTTNFPSGVSLGTISGGLETTTTTGTSQCNVASFTGSPTFAGMPLYTSPQVINYSSSATGTFYSTVFYGIYANTTKPSGSYATTVVYTLVSNP